MLGQMYNMYVRKEDQNTLARYILWCKENNQSPSRKTMGLISNFVVQTTLDGEKDPLGLPRYKTCQFSQNELSNGLFSCLKDYCAKLPIACDRCRHYRLMKK